MPRSGPELAMLLLGGFRTMTDAAIAELERRGYDDVRPVHDFAMRAIVAGAGNASELGRVLSVTKQAAAKTIAVLEARGWVVREVPAGSRRSRLRVTADGDDVLRAGAAIFDDLRREWERKLGAAALVRLENQLALVVKPSATRPNTAGWIVDPSTKRAKRRR